ncbi:MAG: NADH:ubiquinone reductase (Na(+)-transporting) subunit D [Spirochaetales bacterium]|jgi:Na+-transporting NADH:ubiquinone oxidoreductase subunit D|nr:NADH:ubiquinone reductase (Na(+)-transporting) subunit D [Spirochaetales bacterium]
MAIKDLKKTQSFQTFMNGVWRDHPIFSMILGICSALAVSNKVENAIAMGAGVTFVLVATAIIVSLLRKMIPRRVRMIAYMLVIASFVIIVDRFLKAYFPTTSESIGPYVGLIITNCIIMGRAEAFYIQNNFGQSILDAVANGIGYTLTLSLIAIVREVLGFGTILGFQVMPDGFTPWVVMAMAPGAFFVLALFIWVSRTITKMESD